MDSDPVIRELLRRARDGDGASLGKLLDNYREHLRQIAEDGMDDRAAARFDASDLVQQTCLSVYKRIVQFDGEEPAQFAAWLRRIHERNVRNAMRDQLHSEKRDIDREERRADGDVLAARQSTPSQRAARNEESARLVSAIGLLPADEAEALRRRYLEGQSLAEAAAAMGLGKEALAWLLSRAMRNVKRRLSGGP